jgi:hypothetical protein
MVPIYFSTSGYLIATVWPGGAGGGKEEKNLFTKNLPGRLWTRRKPSNKLGSHFIHTKQRGSMSFLGCLGSHAAVFPAKFRTRLSWRQGKGREAQMSVPCSLLLPREITLLPPPKSSTQSSDSCSQSTNLHCWAFCFNEIEMLTHK